MRRGAPTQLVTVLFTDIVSSTEIAREVGDRGWRDLVAAHHRIVRRELKRSHGREQDTAGDGFFAVFARPAEAIRCAVEISDGVRELGLEIRAGLHLGEAEVMGPKVGGVAVNTAARIMALGKAGEVLVSATARDAVAGKGIVFVSHGAHQLKGLDGEYHVYDVVSVDGMARGMPLDAAEARTRRSQLPPEPEDRRRRRALVVGLVAALAVVAGVITWFPDYDAGDASPTPTATTGPRQLSEADSEVVAFVPKAFAGTCVATDPVPRGAVGSVTCTDGDYEARYDTYADAATLRAAFAGQVAGVEDPGTSCRDDTTATDSYTIDGAASGSVACFVEQGTILSYVSTIAWTYDELLMLGRVSREDVTDFRGNVPDLSLYEWWRTAAGPGRDGTFRPKDDPAELPSGTFVSVISPDQVGPANEGGADERWVATWRITLEDGVFREEVVGVYGPFGSELLWGKQDRMVLRRDYQFPPLGGITRSCHAYESLRWELIGDTLVFSDPSPEEMCDDFRGVAVFQPWVREA